MIGIEQKNILNQDLQTKTITYHFQERPSKPRGCWTFPPLFIIPKLHHLGSCKFAPSTCTHNLIKQPTTPATNLLTFWEWIWWSEFHPVFLGGGQLNVSAKRCDPQKHTWYDITKRQSNHNISYKCELNLRQELYIHVPLHWTQQRKLANTSYSVWHFAKGTEL